MTTYFGKPIGAQKVDFVIEPSGLDAYPLDICLGRCVISINADEAFELATALITAATENPMITLIEPKPGGTCKLSGIRDRNYTNKQPTQVPLGDEILDICYVDEKSVFLRNRKREDPGFAIKPDAFVDLFTVLS